MVMGDRKADGTGRQGGSFVSQLPTEQRSKEERRERKERRRERERRERRRKERNVLEGKGTNGNGKERAGNEGNGWERTARTESRNVLEWKELRGGKCCNASETGFWNRNASTYPDALILENPD